jgi:hypothetical protein
MIHTDLPNKPESKRQQIWRLVSEGHSPKDIAARLNTSVENVWKEKSMLKSRGGLVVSRSTTQQSKKQNEMILFSPGLEQVDLNSTELQKVKSRKRSDPTDYLLDIPPLSSDDLKTLYSEFKAKKKPIDIMAEYGFHPEAVEIEYRRFNDLSERDSDELLRSIMLYVSGKGYEKEPAKNSTLKKLIDSYNQKGCLTNMEILELLGQYTKEEVDQRLDLMVFDSTSRLPGGFRRLRCSNCDNTHLDVIVHDKLPLGKEVANKYDGKALCQSCLSEMNS